MLILYTSSFRNHSNVKNTTTTNTVSQIKYYIQNSCIKIVFFLNVYNLSLFNKCNFVWSRNTKFNWININRKITRRKADKYSDVPDSLSGSRSGRILQNLSDVRIRPDPYRDPTDSDLVSKKEYTEKFFFSTTNPV